jgi:hypothetical protein
MKTRGFQCYQTFNKFLSQPFQSESDSLYCTCTWVKRLQRKVCQNLFFSFFKNVAYFIFYANELVKSGFKDINIYILIINNINNSHHYLYINTKDVGIKGIRTCNYRTCNLKEERMCDELCTEPRGTVVTDF